MWPESDQSKSASQTCETDLGTYKTESVSGTCKIESENANQEEKSVQLEMFNLTLLAAGFFSRFDSPRSPRKLHKGV